MRSLRSEGAVVFCEGFSSEPGCRAKVRPSAALRTVRRYVPTLNHDAIRENGVPRADTKVKGCRAEAVALRLNLQPQRHSASRRFGRRSQDCRASWGGGPVAI